MISYSITFVYLEVSNFVFQFYRTKIGNFINIDIFYFLVFNKNAWAPIAAIVGGIKVRYYDSSDEPVIAT